ncbi:Rho termination factor N-terminal domain-containing protein [Aneurinibacillus aneurinilyticus]|jgi:hypothetical protein|uniref:Rho termination factor N-terminal domain-containing protein n=1 Tax=Aneurinibacillus aneurinilyticus TaxID=1391 RepID=UPI0023F8F80C|nr:Rho termination factor N-terminal domain-containing protein [Aneurinibacillus aneurinilyticus]MCI1696895.1 Rho termination factor N-terminal domain-containing protein [Aneurinibacillus aneurinilyticus]
MPYVTYRGENASIKLFGVRFEQKKPVPVEDEKILDELRKQSEFEFNEEKVIPLEDLTVVQLKDKAKAAGIEGFADMKKAELIKALRGE